MRERRKFKSGLDGSYCPKITWPFFKQLQFLESTLQRKSTGLSDIKFPNADEDVEPKEKQDINELGEEHNPDLVKSHIDDSEIRRKRPKHSHKPEIDINRLYPKRTQAASDKISDCRDSDLMFLQSLLPFIKQLGPLDNLELKCEIINLLKQKLQLSSTSECCNQSSCSNSSAGASTKATEVTE